MVVVVDVVGTVDEVDDVVVLDVVVELDGVVDVEVLDVVVELDSVVDVEVLEVEVEAVELVDDGSDVEVVEAGDVVVVDDVVVDEEVVEEDGTDVVVLDVVVLDVVEVVEVGLVPVPPSQEGSTAPGEKLTPGPDLGGGIRVGTTTSFDPRCQVVASGPAEDGLAGEPEVGGSPVDPLPAGGGAGAATACSALWPATSAPAEATTAIPSLSFRMILCPGLPRPGLAETGSVSGSRMEAHRAAGTRQAHRPGSCSARARNSSGTRLTSLRATAA